MLLHAESICGRKIVGRVKGADREDVPTSDGGWVHGGREGPDQRNCITRHLTAGRTCESQARIPASAAAGSLSLPWARFLLPCKRAVGIPDIIAK